MEEKKYNYRSYIKEEANKAKEEEAQKNWKRNIMGVAVSSVLFLIILLPILFGVRIRNCRFNDRGILFQSGTPYPS